VPVLGMKLSVQTPAWPLYKLSYIQAKFRLGERREGDRGSTVVKILRYKSEIRWFVPRWCHWNFSLT
jgi:hypothetical protein